MLSEKAAQFLQSRGFDLERVAMQTEIYSESRGDGEWIVFPFIQRGKIVNRKYRSITEKRFTQDKGGKQIFFNRDVITDPQMQDYPLIITEGEMDALAAICAGFPRVVSVPVGAPNEVGTAKHECLDEAWNDLKDVREFIIAVDNDENGGNLRDDLIGRLGAARCKVAPFPQGCKDLNDALMRHGVKGVRLSIEKAKFVPVEGVFGLDDLPETPPLAPVRLSSLGEDFRKHIGICKGHLSLWTGWANRGKSTVMKQVMVDLAYEKRWRIGAAMFEDDIRRNVIPDFEVLACKKPLFEITADDRRMVHEFIRDQFRFIVAKDDQEPTVPWFLEQAEACVYRYGCDMIVLDPWTDLDLQIGSVGQVQTERALIGAFKVFAKRFNVHIAIIAHPRKPPEIGGSKRLPTGYDISGSAHFMNRAHLGVTIQSHEDAEWLTEVSVWKSKYKEIMGPTGRFFMRFDPKLKRFDGISKVSALSLIEAAQAA